MTLTILRPESMSKHCDLCGYSHWPVEVYQDWITRFGVHHVFKGGKRQGQPTQRTAQTERWAAIVARHAEGADGRMGQGQT